MRNVLFCLAGTEYVASIIAKGNNTVFIWTDTELIASIHIQCCLCFSFSGKIFTQGLAFSFFDTPSSIERKEIDTIRNRQIFNDAIPTRIPTDFNFIKTGMGYALSITKGKTLLFPPLSDKASLRALSFFMASSYIQISPSNPIELSAGGIINGTRTRPQGTCRFPWTCDGKYDSGWYDVPAADPEGILYWGGISGKDEGGTGGLSKRRINIRERSIKWHDPMNLRRTLNGRHYPDNTLNVVPAALKYIASGTPAALNINTQCMAWFCMKPQKPLT